jgi:hypothetical protein
VPDIIFKVDNDSAKFPAISASNEFIAKNNDSGTLGRRVVNTKNMSLTVKHLDLIKQKHA